MYNFEYHTPTKLIFGKGVISRLPEVMKPLGKRILLTYGGGSIKKIGLYDEVKRLMAGFELYELGGIEPNPKYSTSVVEGVRICKEKNIDAMNHIFEQYFCEGNTLSDGLCEATLRTLVKNAPIAVAEPDNYTARAEIFAACSLACNGILSIGNSESGWPMHGIEHALSGYYDITHGVGLAIITPHWMRHILCERTLPRFVSLGTNVFGVNPGLPAREIAEKTIEEIVRFFKSIGIPMILREVGIDESRLSEMAHHIAVNEGLDGDSVYYPLNESDILEILKAAL